MRVPEEREGDLAAQLGAMLTGEARLTEIVERYGFEEADAYATGLIEYTARHMRARLAEIPEERTPRPTGSTATALAAVRSPFASTVAIDGAHARVDFSESDRQVPGPFNAVESITVSAVYYVFRTLLTSDVPASAGVLEPIDVVAPPGSIVNAQPPAAVAAGNVETSQRIVDTLYRALAPALPDVIPAASQGTMNNLTIGGVDPRTGRQFAYYETIGGGMGARPTCDGLHAVHTHMTNSLNTPLEALELAYPFRVVRYGVRRGSGGGGQYRGGDGVVREIELLCDARVTILSDRRVHAPYGLAGGEAGQRGRNVLIPRGDVECELPGVCSLDLHAGDRVRIETPGGGGFGAPARLIE